MKATLLALAAFTVGCGSGCGGNRTPRTRAPREPVAVESPTAAAPLRTMDVGERSRAVGTNLPPANYYSGSFPFVDLMKATFGWISGSGETWDDHRPLDTDEHGWLRRLAPGQTARVFLLAGDQYHPTGRFTVLYEGKGRIEYRGLVRDVERAQGRDTFVLDAPQGLYLDIPEVDPEDPIRNIRVLVPGGRCEGDARSYCESDDACNARCVPFEENHQELPFHPTFLDETRPYSVLRFMDWQETNREGMVPDAEEQPLVVDFDDYPQREDFSWRPVPVDVMIDLANLLDADPWFNMPHSASDAFVARFAARVAERLESDCKVYVEYSNEYWNNLFDQNAWIGAAGCEAHSDDPADECDPDGNGKLCELTEWNATMERCAAYGKRYFTERTIEIGRIWRQAFANAEPERVQRVIGAQIGGADWFVPEYLLRSVNGQPAHTQLDVLAVAPYFGGGERTERSLDAIFARTQQAQDGAAQGMYRMLAGEPDAEWGDIYHWIRNDLRMLRERVPRDSIRYVAYEGGQHLTSHDQEQNALFHRANRDPRMESLYTEYLEMWRELSGDALFVHFTAPAHWGQYGSFGSKEYMGQPLSEAPKERALRHFAGFR